MCQNYTTYATSAKILFFVFGVGYVPNIQHLTHIPHRDGNFAPPHFDLPYPAPVFPAPQRWWGGDGAIFCPRTSGRGGDGFSIFIPAPSPPRPALIIRTIIVNLVNPKSLIFKVKHKTLDKIFFILNLLLLPLALLPSLLSIHVFQF